MYRTEEHKQHKPVGHVTDRAVGMVIEIANGIVSRIAIPCYYVYDKHGLPLPPHVAPTFIDHLGWPNPGHPDHSLQPVEWYGVTVDPIHLSDEGYRTADFIMGEDAPRGLYVNTSIDDNVIRIAMRAMCDDADVEQVEVPFSLYLSGNLQYGFPARDLVTSGIVRIVPALHSKG